MKNKSIFLNNPYTGYSVCREFERSPIHRAPRTGRVNAIENIYCNDKACIKINNKEVTETFEINQGVKQGRILSTLLFNMSDLPDILDSNLNEINPNPDHPNCLLWADDIIIFSENEEEGLKNMLKSIEEYYKENGRLIRAHFSFKGISPWAIGGGGGGGGGGGA